MARRRHKKRTHVVQTEEEFGNIPRSMVIHLGTALKNHQVGQLVKDTRNMMQPHTAISLRERKANKVKDFVSIAGTIGVSYMMLFSQNEKSGSIHLRMAKTPKGPTISYKVLEYSLCKDVARNVKNPKSLSKGSLEFQTPPLLVLNGFTNPKDAEPQEKLAVTMFQNMFPPINPEETKVGTIKRVMLVNKDKETGVIDIRHYAIDTKLVDVSKNVRKLVTMKKRRNKKLPNLGKVQDVADIILDPYAQAGFTSDSEVEDDAVVEVAEENVDEVKKEEPSSAAAAAATSAIAADEQAAEEPAGNIKRKKAVKLTEIGPRLKLKLEKITEGVCQGKTIYHSRIHKSAAEEEYLEEVHAKRRRDKESRQKAQRENVEKKKKRKTVKFAEEPTDEEEEEEEEEEDNTVDVMDVADERSTVSPVKPSEDNYDDDKLFDE